MWPCVCHLQPLLTLISFAFLTRGENCPATCLCPDPHTVDCSGRGLTRLPDDIPLDVRRLLLSDNWIPHIPEDFFLLYSDLVYLDLRNNSLSQIDPGTLSTSSRLVFLDLGSNNLTEIPQGAFGESQSLIKLRLDNNPHLSQVNEHAFQGLTSLRELELERNALSGLEVEALSELPSLRLVRLEGNPWVCNCNFANFFNWLIENSHKLPNEGYALDGGSREFSDVSFQSDLEFDRVGDPLMQVEEVLHKDPPSVMDTTSADSKSDEPSTSKAPPRVSRSGASKLPRVNHREAASSSYRDTLT
ncbi:hypothetical protein P4O66_006160 [Electrophorus voltai]|uniref:LRRNT domain-containing protein n=1 Tax=Electrophorus voltai TaxID=2609070 RepID=A0AAD8ZJM2_9TELE|nr:hypothetical protein P4O66_006160 [Electrophorus voltai]